MFLRLHTTILKRREAERHYMEEHPEQKTVSSTTKPESDQDKESKESEPPVENEEDQDQNEEKEVTESKSDETVNGAQSKPVNSDRIETEEEPAEVTS